MHKSYKAVSSRLTADVSKAVTLVAGVLLVISTLVSWQSVRAETAIVADDGYKIQPGDVLNVSVWKEPDLQSEVLVRPDGGLSFALAGDVQVQGQSVAQLQVLLTERLRKYIPDPVVTVTVKLASGSRIYVLGKVNRPGDYPLNRPIDVMQALSLAGGTTPFASVNSIEILRREGDKQTAIAFRYGDVEKGKGLEQNLVLKSGDTVVVP
jgi:polysaccharide biosynthesis/export protein